MSEVGGSTGKAHFDVMKEVQRKGLSDSRKYL